MKTRTLIGLAAVTVVVVAGAIAAAVSRHAATERVTSESTALPELMTRINDVAEISFRGAGDDFSVRFDGERWVVPELASFPADFDKVKKALIGLAELRTVEAKTADPERYAALGLAPPDAEEGAGTDVRLLDGSGGGVAALTVGNAARAGANRLYIRRDGEERTWLARGGTRAGRDAEGLGRHHGPAPRRRPRAPRDDHPRRRRRGARARTPRRRRRIVRPSGHARRGDAAFADDSRQSRARALLSQVRRCGRGERRADAGRRRFHRGFRDLRRRDGDGHAEKRGEEETWARFDASWDAAAVVETEAPEEETEEAAEEDAEAAEEEAPDVEAENRRTGFRALPSGRSSSPASKPNSWGCAWRASSSCRKPRETTKRRKGRNSFRGTPCRRSIQLD